MTFEVDELRPSFESVTSFSLSGARPVDKLAFHPTSSGLLASSSGPGLSVHDVSTSSPAATLETSTPSEKGHWDLQWSLDGRSLAAAGKDGHVHLWTPRGDAGLTSFKPHAGPPGKPVRLAWLNDHLLLTTGTNQTRGREAKLWDTRSPNDPVHTAVVDQGGGGTGVLVPLVDAARRIAYLFGRGDSSIRWLDFSQFFLAPVGVRGSTPVVGMYNGAVPVPIAGAAMLPLGPQSVDVMKAELCKFVVLGKGGEVVPVVVQAPKRSYIDFHHDVMPDVPGRESAQSGKDWLGGGDVQRARVSQDPMRQPLRTAPAPLPTAASASTLQAPVSAASASAPAPTPAAPTNPISLAESTSPQVTEAAPVPSVRSSAPPIQEPSPPRSALPTTGPASYGVRAGADDGRSPLSRSATQASASDAPARWSRKFLSGKTPLKTDYDDLHNLSSTFSPDRSLIRASKTFFFFPLGGPGGRLGMHKVADKQRLPFAVPHLTSGATIVDFAADPFDDSKVFVAADDGKIRAFELPRGDLDLEGSEPVLVLEGASWCAQQKLGSFGVTDSGIDRISQILPHPTARDLLLCISHDKGTPTIRLWDLGQRSVAMKHPLPGGQFLSSAWSLDGRRLAFTTKAKKLFVLDPRDPEASLVSGPSHESVRTSQVVWVDDSHLLTTGFSRSAMREVLLHRVSPSGTTVVARRLFDVSPAPLFAHFDPDTSIAYLWSKGERTLHALEVHPSDDDKAFDELPAFVHSTLQSGWAFLPKTAVDVKRVEVAKALRLTPTSVESVSFTIPRARTEFFQDDVFPPTRDVETPSTTAEKWLAGEDEEVKRVDLRPEGMKLLSEAPLTKVQTDQRAKVATSSPLFPSRLARSRSRQIAQGPVMTDSQKREQYLDKLFSAAQDRGHQSTGNFVGPHGGGVPSAAKEETSSDEEQVGRSRVGAPPDDDW